MHTNLIKFRKKEECLNEGCNTISYTRGLCSKCYGHLLYAVQTGKTSWNELEKKGAAEKGKYRKFLT